MAIQRDHVIFRAISREKRKKETETKVTEYLTSHKGNYFLSFVEINFFHIAMTMQVDSLQWQEVAITLNTKKRTNINNWWSIFCYLFCCWKFLKKMIVLEDHQSLCTACNHISKESNKTILLTNQEKELFYEKETRNRQNEEVVFAKENLSCLINDNSLKTVIETSENFQSTWNQIIWLRNGDKRIFICWSEG